MRKIIFIILSFVLVCNTSFAQDAEDVSKSKSIKFMAKSGSLIKKEFYDLPEVKGINNQVLIITDILSGKKLGCMRIETSYYNGHSSDLYVGTLDYEEIDACIKSLTYIKDKLLQTKPKVYTETIYKTLDNLKIGAYYSKEKSTWRAFIYTKEDISHSAEFIDTSNIATFIDIMKQAKTMIAEKTKINR